MPMPEIMIDTLVLVIADQNGGKSNQIRSIFEEFELHHFYNGYPRQKKIGQRYDVHPDIELYMRLSSWHETKHEYADVVADITRGHRDARRRYKVLVPAQVAATDILVGGERMFRRLCRDFAIRRAFAVWLSPDRLNRTPFRVSAQMTRFMATRRWVSALSIDSHSAHPGAAPLTNSMNARLLADLLFRV
jgi:hypothetical protein